MISTRNLSELPAPIDLMKLAKTLAMLDAILERNWQSRYYSFNSKWDQNEELASMRNGEGDSWFCVFGNFGAFLKGFAHESEIARRRSSGRQVWPGVLADVPPQFNSCVNEPAFLMGDTTFCIWRTPSDSEWRRGNIVYPPGDDPDGSARLLLIFDLNPLTYRHWAQEYYGRPIDEYAVNHPYAYRPLTNEVVKRLNPKTDLSEVSEDVAEISYPVLSNSAAQDR